MAIAFIFPGQGSQDVGMGRELAQAYPSARAVFDEVDDALGQKLSQIMWEGPKETLTLTENAQPALMAVSMAVMRVLEKEHGLSLKDKVKFVAGHSLGEYSALDAAGAFSLADVPGVAVVVEKAGDRGLSNCARSWLFTADVGNDSEFPDVSARDARVLHELQALGRL